MRSVTFKDGQSMAWPLYRQMMLGDLSPQAAVAQTRREPAGAYDAAMPRRRARDQNANSGRLTPEFYRANLSYLAQNGVPDDVVQQIAGLLGAHVREEPAEDSEPLEMAPEKTLKIGSARGPVGAADRRLAYGDLDQHGRPRSNPATAMPLGGDDRGFTQRFPGINIRVL
jgi:hypothetical protein